MSAAEHRALRGTGLEVRSGSATSVGRVRDHNEDSLIAEGAVFAVADGMGGHAAGEVASGIAIQALATLVERPPTPFLRANARLIDLELFNATRGDIHRGDDLVRWLDEAGLRTTARFPLRRSGGQGVIVAEKPR